MVDAPYGSWPSPITAQTVARAGVRLEAVAFGDDGSLWWAEGRPTEDGRTAVVRHSPDGTVTDVLPPGWNARTRVHEYGGGAWLPVGDGLVFAHWDDQRLYLVDGDVVQPLTPEPEQPQADRYADPVLAPGHTQVWCVRERAVGLSPSDVRRDIVAVPLDGSGAVRTLVVDGHFLSSPRPSPDGRHLAWLTWDHPRMPWDGTELRVAALSEDGSVGPARTLLGGDAESVFQPEWAGTETIYAVSDPGGWWNLYEVPLDGRIRPLCPREEEFGVPQWLFGMTTYGVLDDGRLVVTHGTGTRQVSLLDPADGSLAALDLPFTDWGSSVRVHGRSLAAVAGGPATPPSVVTVDLDAMRLTVVRASVAEVPDERWLPVPREETFRSDAGRDVHAIVYPPRHPDHVGTAGERPPYVAFVHGGPTSQVRAVMNLSVAYFTSRGIGVVDVNYGGSTGYGRAYRERLREQWGVVDVEDVVTAVSSLAARGEADPARLLVRGGSAGGWTVLAALTRTDGFAGGASYYGVAELLDFARDTHDFESRYLDGLVGPLPDARDRYVERAPLSHVDSLSCPVLLLQGLEDRVVPPSQAEVFLEALRRKRIAHAYVAFEGEQHGFRRAETITASLEAELSFYGQVCGFVPVDVPVLPLIRG